MEHYLRYLPLKHRVTMDVLCLIVFNLCDQQISLVKHFSVDLIEFEFGNKEVVEF